MEWQISHPRHSPVGNTCQLCRILLDDLFQSFDVDSQALGMFETVIETRAVQDLEPDSCRVCALIRWHIALPSHHGEAGAKGILPAASSLEIRPSIPINGCFELGVRGEGVMDGLRISFSAPNGLF